MYPGYLQSRLNLGYSCKRDLITFFNIDFVLKVTLGSSGFILNDQKICVLSQNFNYTNQPRIEHVRMPSVKILINGSTKTNSNQTLSSSKASTKLVSLQTILDIRSGDVDDREKISKIIDQALYNNSDSIFNNQCRMAFRKLFVYSGKILKYGDKILQNNTETFKFLIKCINELKKPLPLELRPFSSDSSRFPVSSISKVTSRPCSDALSNFGQQRNELQQQFLQRANSDLPVQQVNDFEQRLQYEEMKQEFLGRESREGRETRREFHQRLKNMLSEDFTEKGQGKTPSTTPLASRLSKFSYQTVSRRIGQRDDRSRSMCQRDDDSRVLFCNTCNSRTSDPQESPFLSQPVVQQSEQVISLFSYYVNFAYHEVYESANQLIGNYTKSAVNSYESNSFFPFVEALHHIQPTGRRVHNRYQPDSLVSDMRELWVNQQMQPIALERERIRIVQIVQKSLKTAAQRFPDVINEHGNVNLNAYTADRIEIPTNKDARAHLTKHAEDTFLLDHELHFKTNKDYKNIGKKRQTLSDTTLSAVEQISRFLEDPTFEKYSVLLTKTSKGEHSGDTLYIPAIMFFDKRTNLGIFVNTATLEYISGWSLNDPQLESVFSDDSLKLIPLQEETTSEFRRGDPVGCMPVAELPPVYKPSNWPSEYPDENIPIKDSKIFKKLWSDDINSLIPEEVRLSKQELEKVRMVIAEMTQYDHSIDFELSSQDKELFDKFKEYRKSGEEIQYEKSTVAERKSILENQVWSDDLLSQVPENFRFSSDRLNKVQKLVDDFTATNRRLTQSDKSLLKDFDNFYERYSLLEKKIEVMERKSILENQVWSDDLLSQVPENFRFSSDRLNKVQKLLDDFTAANRNYPLTQIEESLLKDFDIFYEEYTKAFDNNQGFDSEL